MTLQTERLELVPLTAEMLAMLTTDRQAFERHTGRSYDGEAMEGFILTMFAGQVENVRAAGEAYPMITFWLFYAYEHNCFVGSACFKHMPDAEGAIEIGYGINDRYAGKGYTTEAVQAMIGWGLKQPGVSRVIAETEKDNAASIRVVNKCGMTQYRTTEDCYWWEARGGQSN